MSRQARFLTGALTVVLAAPLFGQSHGKGQEGKEPAKAPTFVPLQIGREAKILDPKGEVLGYAANHVIHRVTGRVEYFVVQAEADPTPRLVPYQRFRWNAENKRLELPLTVEQLMSLPAFSAEEVQALVDPTSTAGGKNANGQSARPSEGPAREGQEVQEKGHVVLRNLLSDGVLKAHLEAEGSTIGAIEWLLLEPVRGTVPLALVKTAAPADEGDLVVPWLAMDRNADGDFVITKSSAELGRAPRVKIEDLASLSDPETLGSIYRFYGVQQKPVTPPTDRASN